MIKLNIDKYVFYTYCISGGGFLKVMLSSLAKKQLSRSPEYIAFKFDYWLDLIQMLGLRETRKYKGFHDEPLQGDRKNQRSIRLSNAYRVILRDKRT